MEKAQFVIKIGNNWCILTAYEYQDYLLGKLKSH